MTISARLICIEMILGSATDLTNTAIQCVHVHTAPILDSDAKRLLAKIGNPVV